MARKTTSIPEKTSTRAKAPVKRHKKADVQAAQLAEAARPVSTEDVARLAFSYWEQRGYQHGSAEADWVRAERELFSVNR